ncbi:long-chain acyl-CoA synthetase 7 [Prunus dulcis]|uniref:Long-chain acyl-CoA synthetase 7 n=1 Tax=Prunus dulcis TaxID=3755 RepID=A0A4Y1RRX7_PRUDU|nr:long-chain acyl-CoA synthetase 7 [Prunus dulcis]
MESLPAPQRRLHAIHSHLLPPSTDHPPHSHLHANLTAGEFAHGHGYSVVLPEKLHTGKWDVHRSARSPFNLVSRFADHPQIGTLHDNFVRSVEVFRDYKFLGTRNRWMELWRVSWFVLCSLIVRNFNSFSMYKWMTYGEAATAREAIGSGLRFHGLEKGACVGLYFINRPEWLIVDYACSAYSFISVPLYDTLGPDAVKYAVNHAGVQAVFCAPQTLSTMLTFVSEIPSVQLIVVVGGMDEHLPSLPSTSRVKLISYLKLISQGRSNLQPFCPPKPEDVATICYTSGTTGTPKTSLLVLIVFLYPLLPLKKGVVLTHGNFIANAAGFCHAVTFYPSDIYISYLPLAHIYERTNQIISVYYGVAIGFYQGDNLKLMDDLVALRPTLFCSVPRLYNRIYAGIANSVKKSGTLRRDCFKLPTVPRSNP